MSGLHTSINTHIAEKYLPENPDDAEESTANMTYFYERVGDYKERIKNLYKV